MKRTIVVGIGNPILGDDAVGIEGYKIPDEIKLAAIKIEI